MSEPLLSLKVDVDRVAWHATSVPGVQWHLLASDAPVGQSRGAAAGATVLVRMEPGCGYPPHRHVGVEDVLVLAGAYFDDLGTHRAGEYVRYPAGSSHAPVAVGDPDAPVGARNPACVLFAVARGGIEVLGE